MANTIDSDLIPHLIGDAQEALSQTNALAARCTRDAYSMEAGRVGQSVYVAIPPKLTAETFSPANIAPAPDDMTVSQAEIKIDQAYKASYAFSYADFQDYKLGGPTSVVSETLKEAVRAVMFQINSNLWTKYYKIPYFAGAAGTGQFASDPDQLAELRRVLVYNRNQPKVFDLIVPLSDYQAALQLDVFQKVNEAPDAQARMMGILQTTLGFNIHEDQQSSDSIHTVGTITTGLIAKASTAVSVGTASVVATTAASTGACALKKGDIITIGTGTSARNYALQADATQASAATDVTLTLDRGLEVALVGSEAIILAASASVAVGNGIGTFGTSVNSVGGDFKGFGLITRLPEQINEGNDNGMFETQGRKIPVIDPTTGVALQLTLYPQYKQVAMEVSCLWGGDVVDSRRLVRSMTTAT